MMDKQNPVLAATSKPGDRLLLNNIQSTPSGKVWECPYCGQILSFQSLDWIDELSILLGRVGGEQGILPDLADLNIIERYGLYLYLSQHEKTP